MLVLLSLPLFHLHFHLLLLREEFDGRRWGAHGCGGEGRRGGGGGGRGGGDGFLLLCILPKQVDGLNPCVHLLLAICTQQHLLGGVRREGRRGGRGGGGGGGRGRGGGGRFGGEEEGELGVVVAVAWVLGDLDASEVVQVGVP